MMDLIQVGKEAKGRGRILSKVTANGKCRCFGGNKLQRVGDNHNAVSRWG